LLKGAGAIEDGQQPKSVVQWIKCCSPLIQPTPQQARGRFNEQRREEPFEVCPHLTFKLLCLDGD
jgi:hypothetical protein